MFQQPGSYWDNPLTWSPVRVDLTQCFCRVFHSKLEYHGIQYFLTEVCDYVLGYTALHVIGPKGTLFKTLKTCHVFGMYDTVIKMTSCFCYLSILLYASFKG